MGAAPSIITIPSTSISRDVEAMKALCPSRFMLEKPPSTSAAKDGPNHTGSHETMAIMKDKNGPLTVILVAIPAAAANRIASNRVTFVVQEAELRSVVNRCEDMRLLTSKTPQQPQPPKSEHEVLSMAEFNLPGGAGIAIVAPSMASGPLARYELGKKLAESMTQSLPKGVARTASNRDLIIGSPQRASTSSTPTSPERRQSSSSPRTTSPLTKIDTQGRIGSLHVRRLGSPHHGTFCGTPRRTGMTPTRSSSFSKRKQQQEAKIKEFIPPVPTFPSLKFNSLHLNGKYKQDFFANARIPIPVETELFVGQMVFLLRDSQSTDKDSFWKDRIFDDNNKRRLVLQLQGKLKYEPKGLLYAGFEASNDLKPGRISKG